jgi:hypothetical protein
MQPIQARQRRIRLLLIFFICALAISGLTAIPLQWEIKIIERLAGPGSIPGESLPGLGQWIGFVYQGLMEAYSKYSFLAYGTDWLAFAHLVIAIAFIGPLRDPVRNIWVIELGLIACAFIIPWVLVFGPLRAIPLFWMLIDMSFGVFGAIPLWLVRREILMLGGEDG